MSIETRKRLAAHYNSLPDELKLKQHNLKFFADEFPPQEIKEETPILTKSKKVK